MIGAIVFARMTSSRLPAKEMLEIQSKPILQHVIERIRRSKQLEMIVLATTMNPADDVLEELGKRLGVNVFRGSEHDVLDRCYRAAIKFSLDPVVRITADDPCKDPEIIDQAVNAFIDSKGCYELVCNTQKPTFPEGLDVEVISFSALERTWKEASDPLEREHVTMHMLNNPGKFRTLNIENSNDLSDIRLTIDTMEDFRLIKSVYDALYPANSDFSWKDVVRYLELHPELLEVNKNVKKSGRYQRR